jgi:hypothetical protein
MSPHVAPAPPAVLTTSSEALGLPGGTASHLPLPLPSGVKAQSWRSQAPSVFLNGP